MWWKEGGLQAPLAMAGELLSQGSTDQAGADNANAACRPRWLVPPHGQRCWLPASAFEGCRSSLTAWACL